MTDERPLHVRVAEALGWKRLSQYRAFDEWIGVPPDWPVESDGYMSVSVPRFDVDWSVTGPLIEKYGFQVCPWNGVSATRSCRQRWPWLAIGPDGDRDGAGTTLLLAVCDLILTLAAEGRLKP